MLFQDFLTQFYGKRIQDLTIEKSDGLHFLPEKIHQDYPPNHDKCQNCPARIYRQDLPFWTGSHKNKKLMVIAQDAGKGMEDWGLNTVFSIHNAHSNLEAYFAASHKHIGYFNLFRDLIGNDNFLDHIYFTDIIKCAYSTGSEGSFELASCKDQLFYEIDEVAPSAIILMGKAAQNGFIKLVTQQNNSITLLESFKGRINLRSTISFYYYQWGSYKIYMIPHLIGNLHISSEFKDEFDQFKQKIINFIGKNI